MSVIHNVKKIATKLAKAVWVRLTVLLIWSDRIATTKMNGMYHKWMLVPPKIATEMPFRCPFLRLAYVEQNTTNHVPTSTTARG
jgi:hypothetical protein